MNTEKQSKQQPEILLEPARLNDTIIDHIISIYNTKSGTYNLEEELSMIFPDADWETYINIGDSHPAISILLSQWLTFHETQSRTAPLEKQFGVMLGKIAKQRGGGWDDPYIAECCGWIFAYILIDVLEDMQTNRPGHSKVSKLDILQQRYRKRLLRFHRHFDSQIGEIKPGIRTILRKRARREIFFTDYTPKIKRDIAPIEKSSRA